MIANNLTVNSRFALVTFQAVLDYIGQDSIQKEEEDARQRQQQLHQQQAKAMHKQRSHLIQRFDLSMSSPDKPPSRKGSSEGEDLEASESSPAKPSMTAYDELTTRVSAWGGEDDCLLTKAFSSR